MAGAADEREQRVRQAALQRLGDTSWAEAARLAAAPADPQLDAQAGRAHAASFALLLAPTVPESFSREASPEAMAIQAALAGDFTQARSLAGPRGDARFANLAGFAALAKAIRAEDYAEALKQAAALPGAAERAAAFVQVADAWRARNDPARARQTLLEGAAATQSARPDRAQVAALLTIVEALIPLDAARAFALMEAAVAAANGLTGQSTAHGEQDFAFDASLRALARVNFDRALLLARDLQPSPASLLAQLALCLDALKQNEAAPSR